MCPKALVGVLLVLLKSSRVPFRAPHAVHSVPFGAFVARIRQTFAVGVCLQRVAGQSGRYVPGGV